MDFLIPILQGLTLLAVSTLGGLVIRYLRPIFVALRGLPELVSQFHDLISLVRELVSRVHKHDRAIGVILDGDETEIARLREQWARHDQRAAAGPAPGTAR